MLVVQLTSFERLDATVHKPKLLGLQAESVELLCCCILVSYSLNSLLLLTVFFFSVTYKLDLWLLMFYLAWFPSLTLPRLELILRRSAVCQEQLIQTFTLEVSFINIYCRCNIIYLLLLWTFCILCLYLIKFHNRKLMNWSHVFLIYQLLFKGKYPDLIIL